jgi:hypothetical protein
MVDTDKDATISAAEFKVGCGKGWVQSAGRFNHQADDAARQTLSVRHAA